jgi:FAD:protein FMN transferase
VLVLFVLAALAVSCKAAAAAPEWVRIEKSTVAMGSSYTVVVYGFDRVALQAAVDAALDEVQRLDEMLTNYDASSEWSGINRNAAQRPVQVTPEMFRLLESCLNYSRQSEGAFDISVGPLMKVWGFYKGSKHLPHKAEVDAALTRVGYKHIQLDAARRTVKFDRAGVEIDPGGIGKGYAVDRMVEVLRRNGIQSGMVAGSLSSIYGIGVPPTDSRGWRVEIKDPRNQQRTVAEVFLKNQSMSTSGSYEKFFVAEGRTWAHIMDPRTGYPASGSLSVSVIAPRTLDSEAWTKPYFINGRQWTARRKPKDFRVFFCEDRTDQPCAWLP